MTGKSFYLDTCLLVSLAFGDGGFPALEIWLEQAQSSSLWISQLVILELSDVLARSQRRGDRSAGQVAGMHLMLSEFAKERLGLLEPRSPDFERACEWVKDSRSPALRGADALHLAIAQSHNLELITADQALVQAAQARGIPCLML
ncbi:type II toxin-antitoxin system VapC family toxin [Synechococcus sp. WH 8016]|jgi:predicted nucleic acid-binding protein|uniref:type II toxin-antitoxin system VapC family toxin n=1 Tax=Synechococcus sp. WH 8016 TaxID=166318 RepID=UPI00022D9EA2|nr:type II toxin-antitoxin system VapC family toxin [Synechococcus sp. WH 8016]EHA62402.1 PilT protein domain protein [Synechococcus sp. WH 8016]